MEKYGERILNKYNVPLISPGIIALVSDLEIADTPGCARFRLDQIKELSAFIETTLRLRRSGHG
jgi:hypothetical protein